VKVEKLRLETRKVEIRAQSSNSSVNLDDMERGDEMGKCDRYKVQDANNE